ncbi:Serine/threonine-protein kinase ATM [Caenorhabditis elegans]|nr:Serine/threonine-protein kinase ATM [Caenorhabditis elegans]CDK13476.1 Serine/threonine-protein kinase ATM [Caenorhabditis elegans]|eukprot:NP_001293215.1 Serine/threonine-protein kinase ATM [Caenorhabditis elegans]
MYKKLYQIMEDQEEDEFLQSARHFSKWPQNLTLPIQKQTINCMAVFFEANLDNQLVDLCQWSDRRKVLVEMLAELAATRSEIRDKLQKSMPFNKFVKECIMENRGDLYEMTKRFEKYSFLLSIRNLIVTRMIITNEAARLLGDGETISETDIFIIEKRTLSTCIRNVSEGKELSGYTLDPYTVAANVHNVHFDHINVEIYLELLKKSPFFAQNIVRHLLRQNGKEAEEETWHLHATVLKIVMKDEKLLAVCVATIPNMVRYLKVYQIHFSPKSNAAKFLHLDMESISHCQSYLRKPTKSSNLITAANFLTLFGCEKRTWKRPILRFWSIFKQQPAMCCEKLLIFAEECVELGLNHRIACLLRALTTSEFCRKALCDEYLKIAFQLTYRSIFLILSKNECRPEIVELCDDMNLRYDLLQHQIKHVAAHHLEHFERFETKIAFSVEKFLKSGIDGIDFEDLGLVEFYKQLNENLTEDAIRSNEARNIYIVDILSTIWLQLPSIRPQILPILARFKHISPAWTNFPQPPHISTNEKSFLQHLRFHLYLKMMNISKSMTQGEYATCIMMLLTSYDSSHFVADLIEKKQLGKLKLQQRRNVLCILSRLLKDQAVMGDEDETIIDPILFKAITKASAVFEDTAACIVPFLFKICVDFKGKYDKCVINLLGCLKGVNAEDEIVVRCLAECVDSIGLNVIARYERLNIETHSEFGVKWFFKLSRLFLKHGFTTHSFAIANILFDRLSARKRNTMMIDRTSLDRIDRSQELINLLVEIYVAEGNSVALSSLPPAVQNRPDVRQVMNKSSKEWLKLLSSNQMDSWELTIVQWMCGIQFNAITGDKYLNSILRCNFNEYTKKIDSPLKFVYFQLFHLSTSTLEIEEAISSMPLAPTIDQMRLMIIANATASFEPQSVEEHVVRAVRELRETSNRRKSGGNVKGINEKTTRMVKLAEMLTENKAYDAAINLLDTWEHECLQWTSVAAESIDIDLIRICKQHVTCRSGDPRMADINLRTMHPRVPVMSDLAIAEWSLALSKITIEYRNDMEEGIRILEFGCKHLQNKDSVETRLKVLLKLHSVCIGQLSKLEEYRETRTYRMKQQAVTAFEQQIQNSCRTSLARGNSGDEWTKKTVQRVRKEHQFEKNDLEKVDNSLNSAARKAVSSGFDALLCISQLEDDDEAIRASSLIIFPLIDVIYKYETDVGVIALLKEHTKSKLPSKLWISATSHIASKCFSIEKSQITRHLSQILCHLIYDYPYHVLHTILMYDDEKNASKVKGFLKTIFDARADQRDSSKLKEIVITIREAHQAYREIAMLDVRGNVRIQRVEINGKTMYRWPHDLKIFKCKLRQLPIPTISQKIGCPGDYSTTDLITWKRWKDVFTIADGISTPKIWEIEGSDGKWYKTVWKKDDVRQDVLVEQMFDVTNNMLEKAMLRTYNVVPLDTECGVIEFCGGTVSLKEVMCGVTREGGLHREFNSEEVSASKVSSMMRQVQTESTETRRQVFVEICQQYSPVFRHFFYTNFSTAQIWRQKIINYRQSLATWSIVCYIVGLGDRHASNILFDQKLCTFVHIDLGMILEYSKRTLPVPEQVPFRITRDVLDPILIEGIENGQLAEECTQIMEKLKENGKVILGVASALLRETMTNFREAEQAAGRPSYISEMAIGRLREKLRGTDDGVTAQSSNLQIRRLLREATSADNLSRMFCGWMPFL